MWSETSPTISRRYTFSSQRRQSGLKFGGSKNLDFFQANFRKISIFPSNFPNKNFDFLVITPSCPFAKQNMPFTHATYLQLPRLFHFSFKSHHFSTYSQCMITFNNISRPVQDPPTDPMPEIWGSQHPNPLRIDAYVSSGLQISITNSSFIPP